MDPRHSANIVVHDTCTHNTAKNQNTLLPYSGFSQTSLKCQEWHLLLVIELTVFQ